MTAFHYLFFACCYTSVFAWTIDLPEARHYYFSKYDKNDKSDKNVELKDGEYVYNNIFSNSPYATDSPYYQKGGESPEYESNPIVVQEKSAEEDGIKIKNDLPDEYEYDTYMEKKIHEIVLNGSRYLEGLSKSIEEFSLRLENCTNFNTTTLRATEPSGCQEATKKREQVRQLSQLALHTARLLQDRAYATDHREDEDSFEDHALLMRLAWFLDRLTELTGFDPNGDPREASTRAPSTPAPPINLLNFEVPDDVKLSLMGCLQTNSSEPEPEPATERCRYPLPLPAHLVQFFNITGGQAETQLTNQSSNLQTVKPLDPAASPSQLYETQHQEDADLYTSDSEDSEEIYKFPLTLEMTAVKSVRKRSVLPEKPFEDFIKYFAKHKAWINVNPVDDNPVMQHEFRDDNELPAKLIQKRSVELKIPEDPMQDIGAYIQNRAQTFLNPDENQAKRIREFIENMHQEKKAKVIKKRSLISRPKIPEDPMQDISYYIKNKAGTNLNPDPVQAARVRLGLQQIFQTGNIEVIRRFGSNYNPLIADHNTAGMLRSGADI